MIIHFLENVKAHPPLGARANVERGVEVVVTGHHVNRAAPSGWMERLVSPWLVQRVELGVSEAHRKSNPQHQVSPTWKSVGSSVP